jgi:hypothetical protein|tara:strand:- start:292 stop:540 length:249 start_codon:yes stop_codon:yes gene_type:complete
MVGDNLDDGLERVEGYYFGIIGERLGGGSVVHDFTTGSSFVSCPYLTVGDCLDDPMDAIDCPQDYLSCEIYQSRNEGESFRA